MRPISAYKKGFTIAEVLVASAVFLMLLGVLVVVFYQSTAVMMKGTSQSSLLTDAQAFGRKLSNAIQYDTASSLTLAADGTGMSLLTSDDADGSFRFDPALSVPLWSNFQVFYFDSVDGSVKNREVSVIGFAEEASPGPIENFDSGQTIEAYFSGGKPILRNVRTAEFQEALPGLVRVDIELARDDTRDQGAETFTFSLARNFRN